MPITSWNEHTAIGLNRNKKPLNTEANPSGRAVYGVGLQPSACWDRGLESYRLWCVLECDQMKLQKPSTPTVNKQVEEGRTKK
jgi:hypothetical protein